ncbi:N-acetylneuraminic acid mutarotase [Motilibacter peucedani]|uniref:N-acetylneuraminic acid mutarotase n=1 Tax=Motilibacter peucedani TaxID=598650 RepID=A0A420XVF4_9ACTN|nr:DUF1668 domain-containing protein [Motilibacter peucedani]RKS84268.1 N-acetylneuraminic acid mutarotase [Motilibacter peucedani]
MTTPATTTTRTPSSTLPRSSARRTALATAALALAAAGVLVVPQHSGAVTAEPRLEVSTSPTRSGALPLAGASLWGLVYVTVSGVAGPAQVAFRVDDTGRTRTPLRTDSAAPFDLVGSTSGAGEPARPLDAASLGTGVHVLTADVRLGTGQLSVLVARFSVGRGPVVSLVHSAGRDRAGAVAVADDVVRGPLYAFLAAAPGQSVRRVRFFVDDPHRGRTPARVEGSAPWDLGGTSTDTRFAEPVDTAALGQGVHTLTAEVTGGAGTVVTSTSFTVSGPTPSDAWSWRTATPVPERVTEAQGVALGDSVYVFGSFDSRKTCCVPSPRTYRYSVSSGTWRALAPMPDMGTPTGTLRGGVTHAGVATDGRRIWLAGGYTSDSAGTGQVFGTDRVWQYDTVTGTWSEPSWRLPTKVAAGQLAYVGGVLHYFGGHTYQQRVDTAAHWALDLSDPAAGWQPRAPMPQAVNHFGYGVIGGRIYAVGGQTGFDDTAHVMGTLQVYDPATDSWEVRGSTPLPTPRSHIVSATFVMDGRLVVAGGERADVHELVPTAEVSAYDPVTRRWSSLPPLPAGRLSGVAGPVDGSRWVYAGGRSTSTYLATAR